MAKLGLDGKIKEKKAKIIKEYNKATASEEKYKKLGYKYYGRSPEFYIGKYEGIEEIQIMLNSRKKK